ncbi:MAG TPA: ribonuclease P protein component 1 [Nanoarchaeota archaeon]|nr:ribonuclease P protein component 1 [Nanoarchaeota archaeon]
MITPSNVVRHELIGLHAKVVQARNTANLKLAGKIVNETYKTLVIDTRTGEKRLFKDQVVMQLELPDRKKVEVDGQLLVARPWDRLKKKLAKW